MNNSKDEKSKSNKESILRNWKTLKQTIEPAGLLEKLKICKFLPQSSCEKLGSNSRSHQATLVLIKVYREVQLNQKKYPNFVEILRRDKDTAAAADALSNFVGGQRNKPETVDELLTRDLLERCGEMIKRKLKKHLDVVLEIIDNFIECGLLDIDQVEDLIHLPKDSAHHLVDFVIKNIDRGAYNRLLDTLKSEKSEKTCRGLVTDLTAAVAHEDVNTAKTILQEIRKDYPDVTRETANGGFELSISTNHESLNMHNSLLAERSPADLSVFKTFGSPIGKKKEGSVILRFQYTCSKNVSAVKAKIQEGAIKHMMGDIIRHMEDIDLKELYMSQFEVKLRCLSNNESKISTELVQHMMNENIIVANRSFLIEEINTMALVEAFQDKGITYYDGLDGTLGRQQRAEHFLAILENYNLVNQLLDILREQGMTYVLGRLNNCRNAYLADPEILRPNISNNRTQILDNLDIDDVREIFTEREVFSSNLFDEIEKKYSESEDQMSIVLIEIIKSGPHAMRILLDVMYINQIDSLADNLLRRTPNDMQEMQDNTQTDESSSDGELLYEATFVVSKADEKSPSDA